MSLVLLLSADRPMAVLKPPVVLLPSAAAPTPVFPVVSLRPSAPAPTPVLPRLTVLLKRANAPLAVLPSPVVLVTSVPAPTAVLALPVGRLWSESQPTAVLKKPPVKAQKRVLPLRRVRAGIASVRWRDDRLRSGRKPEAEKRQCDEKWRSCFELNQWIHGSSFLFPR